MTPAEAVMSDPTVDPFARAPSRVSEFGRSAVSFHDALRRHAWAANLSMAWKDPGRGLSGDHTDAREYGQ